MSLQEEMDTALVLAVVKKIVDFAVEYGNDLTELQTFIETIVEDLGLGYTVPNLWELRAGRDR